MTIFICSLIVLCVVCASFASQTAPSKDGIIIRTNTEQTLEQQIMNDLSWPLKVMMWKSKTKSPNDGSFAADGRRVGIQALEMRSSRRQDKGDSEDNNMKMKLFRLMYETVRDSDLKVKRAELIQNHYNTSSSFEVGYLMGDISDKFNIMQDITMTLKRLYNDWKPIEHINAYEQVANQAIEITHIIDLVKTVAKRIDDEEAKKPQPAQPPPTKPPNPKQTGSANQKKNNNTFFL